MATYDLKYPGAAIDAILDTAYDLQNAGYIFRGLASEYSNTPTERSWVLAGEGETGHGFTSPIPKGYIGVCVFNGTSWTGKLLKCVSIDSTPTSGSTNAVSSGGAYASISQLADTVNEALDNLTFTDTTPSAFLGEYITEKVSTTDGGLERILTYFTILSATASKAGLLSAADKAKLDALWSSGYQFAGIATPSTTPISTTSKIFYIATEAGTYFNTVTVTQGINIIYKSGDTWSVAQVVGIDNEPTAGSDRLVKSGGVFGELALGAVYDVSAKNPTAGPNSNGKWESLSALLSDANLNTLIPTSVRKGGMSIKYVQSSDNKYVRFNLLATSFTTDTTQWAIDDAGVYEDNPEFIEVKTDKYGRILWAIKADGTIYFGAGVPPQVKEYITSIVPVFIANKVDKEEGKGLISNDIAESAHYEDDPEFIEVKADALKRLLEATRINGNKVFTGTVEAKGFEGAEFKGGSFDVSKMQVKGVTLEVIDDPEYFIVVKDGLDRLMLGLKQDGDVVFGAGVPKQIKDYVAENGGQGENTKTFDRRQLGNIYNAARYNTGASSNQIPNGKDFQICLSGDPHTNDIAIKHMIELTNKVLSIDAFLVLGDMNGWTPYDGYVNAYDIAGVENTINNIIAEECNKPFYLVCGNHDVGEGRCVKYTRTHQQVYNTFVKPIIDKGYLRNGEYNASAADYADKCYYFHDFNSTKIRLIVLYEYGHPLALADNEYWEPVAYDSSLADIQSGTTYTYDANNPIVLNSGNPTYNEHSFRLKKTVTTCTRSTGENYKTMPYYKMRSRQVFTKNQLDWLIATLNSTPDGYGIIIASHQCLMAGTNLTDNKFSIGSNPNNTYAPRKNGKSYDMMMDNDIIPKIVDAWKNKTSISEKVAATDFASDNQYASYLNVLQDGDYHYMYQINVDFSSRTNNNAFFSNFINGHEHCDMIERSKSFPTLLTVGVTTPNPPYRYMSDVATIMDESSPIYDSITILACSKNRVALCKYGNDTTFAGVDREYEIINPNNN